MVFVVYYEFSIKPKKGKRKNQFECRIMISRGWGGCKLKRISFKLNELSLIYLWFCTEA